MNIVNYEFLMYNGLELMIRHYQMNNVHTHPQIIYKYKV